MKLRSVALTLVAAGALVPIGQAPAQAAGGVVDFTLDAKTIDGGQQVVSVTLDTDRYKINPKSLDVNTFQVHATGANPYPSTTVMGAYDRDRTITSVKLDKTGDIVISMVSGEDAPAAFTFAYSPAVGRNVMLDLKYSINQREALTLRGGKRLTLKSFRQGDLVDPEVDRFSDGMSADGMSYRLFTPEKVRKGNPRPLVVWLHGGGEGGWSESYDNDLPLIANRGALGFATPDAQKIFKGAYVVAPQASTRWMDNATKNYAPQIKALIDELADEYTIDTTRIYVVGASNGGYMTMQMVADYPDFFAGNITICPAVTYNKAPMITDDEIIKMRETPTWIVQAKNDNVLPYETNGLYAHQLIGNSTLSAYPDVVWNGHTYQGHWSWIYVAQNDPTNAKGQHIWQWLAKQDTDKR